MTPGDEKRQREKKVKCQQRLCVHDEVMFEKHKFPRMDELSKRQLNVTRNV